MLLPVVPPEPWYYSLEHWARVAEIVLGASGLLAFYQLRLSRRSLEAAQANDRTRIEREAAVHTVELCKHFAEVTIPQFAKLEQSIKGDGAPLDSWVLTDYAFGTTSIPNVAEANAWIAGLKPEMGRVMINMLNEFEAVAMRLVWGVADERRAFPVLSRMFLTGIERLAPVLISMRTVAVGSGQFPNTVALYQLWHERTRSEAITAQRAQLDQAAKSIGAREIPPIGLSPSKLA